jgi:multidrug efflux pump subunit AcrA (membrane-fusion protein)
LNPVPSLSRFAAQLAPPTNGGRVGRGFAQARRAQPAQQENLNFATSGQVTSVAVTVGQKVKAGQVLATVNSASLAANVAQAKATEASDAAKLSSDLAAGSGVTSAQLTADQAAVTAAENQVTDAEQALAETKLTSPINGVVAALNLSVDQQVSGSGSSGGGAGAGGSGAFGMLVASQGLRLPAGALAVRPAAIIPHRARASCCPDDHRPLYPECLNHVLKVSGRERSACVRGSA